MNSLDEDEIFGFADDLAVVVSGLSPTHVYLRSVYSRLRAWLLLVGFNLRSSGSVHVHSSWEKEEAYILNESQVRVSRPRT
jgi:hypothetical protein